MAAKIENLTDKPIWVRLNSGTSLFIGPRTASEELPKHELDDNAQLDKLVQRGTLARIAAPTKASGEKPARRTESAA